MYDANSKEITPEQHAKNLAILNGEQQLAAVQPKSLAEELEYDQAPHGVHGIGSTGRIALSDLEYEGFADHDSYGGPSAGRDDYPTTA